MSMSNSGPSNIPRDSYYWQQLRELFIEYKQNLRVTNTALAKGLNISRQSIVSFMQGSNKLPIERESLLNLYEYLRNEDVSPDIKKLRLGYFDRPALYKLLMSAGFLVNPSIRFTDLEPDQHQKIQGIILRLCKLKLQPRQFIGLVDEIEDMITKRAFFTEREIFSGFNNRGTEPSKLVQYQQWVEQHIDNPDVNITNIFLKQAIQTIKYPPTHSEMFELYAQIEYNNSISPIASNHHLEIKILDCQFETITTRLQDLKYLKDKHNLKLYVDNICKQAEQYLMGLSPSESEYLVISPVVEVKIYWQFKQEVTDEEYIWSYCSSATQLQNLLAATQCGIGYGRDRELLDFSSHSLGQKDFALVKSSAAYCKNGTIYHGKWVDQNAIVAILKAVTIALISWLVDEMKTNTNDYIQYRRSCQKFAQIDQLVYEARRKAKNLQFQPIENPATNSSNSGSAYILLDQALQRISELLDDLKKQSQTILDCYETNLQIKYCAVVLLQVKILRDQGDLSRAQRLINSPQLEQHLDSVTYLDGGAVPIAMSKNIAVKLQDLFSGTLEPIDNLLCSQAKFCTTCMEKLKKYVDDEDLKYNNYSNRLDFDVYLSAADVSGETAMIDFYLTLGVTTHSSSKVKKWEESILDRLLLAAHYAARVDYRLQAAQWLALASRVCCRSGNRDRAIDLANLAEAVITEALGSRMYFEYQESTRSEVYLAQGEQFFLLDQKADMALDKFLQSLKGAIHLGNTRLIADNLYRISQISHYMSNHQSLLHSKWTNVFAKNQIRSNLDKDNRIMADVIKFLNELDKTQDWEYMAGQFLNEAITIWHQWATDGIRDSTRVHPFEKIMREGSFLGRITITN